MLLAVSTLLGLELSREAEPWCGQKLGKSRAPRFVDLLLSRSHILRGAIFSNPGCW